MEHHLRGAAKRPKADTEVNATTLGVKDGPGCIIGDGAILRRFAAGQDSRHGNLAVPKAAFLRNTGSSRREGNGRWEAFGSRSAREDRRERPRRGAVGRAGKLG